MKISFCLLFSIALIAFCSLAAQAQRQTALYIDDGHGAFSILTAPLGGGAITLPGASITFPTTNAAGVLTNTGSGSLSWTAISGFTPAFFNAYTTFWPFTIPAGAKIPLTTVATITGFTSDGSGGYVVAATGVYNVEYTVARVESSAFGISVNGVIQPNSIFGCATGTLVIHGNAILSLTAGADVTLNASLFNSSAVTLETYPPGSGAVEASLTATRIQ